MSIRTSTLLVLALGLLAGCKKVQNASFPITLSALQVKHHLEDSLTNPDAGMHYVYLDTADQLMKVKYEGDKYPLDSLVTFLEDKYFWRDTSFLFEDELQVDSNLVDSIPEDIESQSAPPPTVSFPQPYVKNDSVN